jgi:2-isopropylmalate synthase
MMNPYLYDTTLRDGAQQEGISLSVGDKLKITLKLDELGVKFIEGGWPGSNPKEVEYFKQVKSLTLKKATVTAFGSTRRAGIRADQDPNLKALLDSDASVITLVGKSWDSHVTRILETTLEENLAMISDSVAYLRGQGRRVFFDAEHFLDGFKANRQYALQCVNAAVDGGAEVIVLCDTNGGTLPSEVYELVTEVKKNTSIDLGIHTHNDGELAVANALAGVSAGVVQVQGTINGYGERCGNANLLSLAANLKLKLGISCLEDEELVQLTEIHHFVSEIVNLPTNPAQPFVGISAFGHKGGLHGSAVAKFEDSYQHIRPALVGNSTRMLVSDMAGRGNISYRLDQMGLNGVFSNSQILDLVTEIKSREGEGYQYEGADASFEILVRRSLEGYSPSFELIDYMVIVQEKGEPNSLTGGGTPLTQATVKIKVGNEVRHTAAIGNGPVNALDQALRKALLEDYPSLGVVHLTDYKVRIVDQGTGTGAIVRVLAESTDGPNTWQTVGASPNIIEASWLALVDSLDYWLLKYSSERLLEASGFGH